MTKAVKIAVIIGFILVFFILFAVVVGLREESGHSTPGILGLILLVGVIAGARAIWKYSPTIDNSKKDTNDNHHLDKTM